MKILKWLLGILAFLIIGFLLLGVFKPSISYSSKILVDKSAEESWAVMADPNKASQWITGYVKSELVSGTNNTVGAVSNVHIDNAGEISIIKETITEMIPNKVMAMDFSMDPMDMDYKLTFEQIEGHTRIKSHTVAKGNGFFMKSMLALMDVMGGMKAQEDINMKKLKKLINENTDVY